MDDKKAKRKKKPRRPPIRIPLSFGDAMRGLLAISPNDAKEVRKVVDKKKRK